MPPRKANEAHLAAGTFRADRHGSKLTAQEHEYLTEAPDSPQTVQGPARDRWNELVPYLVRLRILTRRDLALCEVYCIQFGLYEMARRTLEKLQQISASEDNEDGLLLMDDEVVNRCTQVMTKVQPQLVAMLKELGCTPVSRSKLAADQNSGAPAPSMGLPRRSA